MKADYHLQVLYDHLQNTTTFKGIFYFYHILVRIIIVFNLIAGTLEGSSISTQN